MPAKCIGVGHCGVCRGGGHLCQCLLLEGAVPRCEAQSVPAGMQVDVVTYIIYGKIANITRKSMKQNKFNSP